MKPLLELEGSDFHIIAHIAYLVAMLEHKEQDCEHVRMMAYDMYEERKKTGRLGL